MNQLTVQQVVADINAVHRDLAKLSVDQLLGIPSALKTEDVIQLHPLPVAVETTEFLRTTLASAPNAEESERIERILFACLDLALVKETATLGDMLRFYMERGRMIVGSDKIPALEVVPWLQAQRDFDKREEIGKEMTIFLKAIVNPILMGMIELNNKAVQERFGYKNYVSFCEAKKGASFADQARVLEDYLDDTTDAYFSRVRPWVEEKIGRKLDHLSRYHALHLLRISRFDESFPPSRLHEIVSETFSTLGLNPSSRSDVVLDLSDDPVKNPDGICIGVEIPGEIYVLIKPAGGLIDVEALLHEMGHAFFLSHFDPNLPVEYRRLYRSPALDETFAFLFMNLVGNKAWLTGPGRLSPAQAEKLADLYDTKRLCLIRRYIGKFFAQKDLYENGDIKNSDPYCRYLNRATGFIYEPQGYLIDMESDFYALDYLNAWAGANTLGGFLEGRFGENWFEVPDAGDFLRNIAAAGRRELLEPVIQSRCGQPPRLPEFS